MVSFNTFTVSVLAAAAVTSVNGQNLVQSIAEKVANGMIQNRNANVPEVVARSEVSKLVGFVTTDAHFSGYLESAMQTADHSQYNPQIASAALTSIGSVVSSVTRRPDFYQMINSARHNTGNYNMDAIMTMAQQEVGSHAHNAYAKAAAVSSTDAGVSSLFQSLSRDFLAVATKVLLNGAFNQNMMVDLDNSGSGEMQLNLANLLDSYPGINEFWGNQEMKNEQEHSHEHKH